MLRSIVVPLDGTTASEEALPFAERIAGASGATLHLARVCTPAAAAGRTTAYPHEGTGLPPEPGSGTDDGEAYLEAVARTVAGRGRTPVEATVLEGDLPGCLLEFARKVEADGVVMATRAPGVLSRVLLGSVTDAVLRGAEIPVLVVRAGTRTDLPPRLGPVLVALDGSEASEAVLPTVAALAPLLGVRVTLLHVLPAEGAAVTLPFHLPGDWERIMADGEAYLERVQDRLRRRRIRTDTIVMAHPSPARAICEVADEIGAGLVALGTHGRSGIGRALLGSVARRVVSHGHRPVLIRKA